MEAVSTFSGRIVFTMSAYMLVVVCGERPVGDKDYVLLRSDNEAALHWVRCRREVKEP